MLNKTQAQYVNRAIKLKVLFNENKEVILTYKAFAQEMDSFLAYLGVIEKELPEKDTKGNGKTTAKDELKKTAAEDCADICGFAKSYAVATGNADLTAATGCSYSNIIKMQDAEVLGFVTKIYNLLMPLTTDEIFAGYGVTPETLEDMLTAATKFNDSLGQAAVTDANSSVANANIDAALAAINKNVEQFDLLIRYFKKKHPDLVKGYLKNRKLSDAGVKHSGVEGVVMNEQTKEPVKGVVVRLADTDKAATSNLTGTYQLIKVKSGDYKLEVAVNGAVVNSRLIKIQRGKIQELNLTV